MNCFENNRHKIKRIEVSDTREDLMEKCIYNLILAIGDNPDRPGLVKTPNRVRRMYDEIFEGMNYTNEELAKMFDVCFDEDVSDDLVTVTNIPIFSTCEHHMATMYSMKVHVGYIPNGKVIGLSKVARVADMVSKRLQLQERIGSDIADVLEKILNTEDIIVVIEGEHACMTMRGIKKPGTVTRTATLRGSFKNDSDLRKEFYSLIRN